MASLYMCPDSCCGCIHSLDYVVDASTPYLAASCAKLLFIKAFVILSEQLHKVVYDVAYSRRCIVLFVVLWGDVMILEYGGDLDIVCSCEHVFPHFVGLI